MRLSVSLIIRARLWSAPHLKVIQETRTAETRRTQRFLHILCALSAPLISVSQITPKLSTPRG
jgi:hypothetical protein